MIAVGLIACDNTQAHRIQDETDGGLDAASRTMDGGDAGNEGEPVRWIASKTTLDVWWPWNNMSDLGRGAVEIVSLTRVVGACGDPSTEGTLRVCGVQVPTRTVDFRCEAHALQIPDQVWDDPHMPTFPLPQEQPEQTDAGESGPGSNVAQIGISSEQLAPQADAGACDGDTITQCYPDHDADNQPGLTVTYRNDLATYVGPYDSGECAWPRPYAYRSLTIEYVCAGGICGPQPTIDHQRIGLVASLPSLSQLCAAASPDHMRPVFEIRSAGCDVDFDTIQSWDERLMTMSTECLPTETDFVAAAMPNYRVLGVGETPSPMPTCNNCPTVPYGWTQIGRDIDRTPSEGTKIDSIELEGSATPSCADVRAVFAND